MDEYIVVCKDDGAYWLATRQVYRELGEAQSYVQTISPSRDPHIVRGDFRHLRFRNHQ